MWIGRMWVCRCGVSFYVRGHGKPNEITMHQQFCLKAPGDTIQKDGMGWQDDHVFMAYGSIVD